MASDARSRVGQVDARGHRAGGDVVGEDLQVAVPFRGGQAGQSLAGQEHGPQLAVDGSGEVAFAFTADDDRRSRCGRALAGGGRWSRR